jgi:hypothetical protein
MSYIYRNENDCHRVTIEKQGKQWKFQFNSLRFGAMGEPEFYPTLREAKSNVKYWFGKLILVPFK